VSKNTYFSFPVHKDQNPWLDLLRSLAIVLVLLRHGERAIYEVTTSAIPGLHTVFVNGWVGVDLFLVLSGYLITTSLLKLYKKQDGDRPTINVKHYFRARILRIVPAYYTILILTTIGFFPYFAVEYEQLGLRIIYHLFFLQDYLPADINVVFWSLGVEEKFYIIAPVLILALIKFKNSNLQIIFLITLLLLSPALKTLTFLNLDTPLTYQDFFQQLRSPFHATLEPLVTGVAIGFLSCKYENEALKKNALKLLSITFVIFFAMMLSHEFLADFALYDITLQPLLITFMFGAMVLLATHLKSHKCPLENYNRVISRLSYALYLVHFPLIPFSLGIASIIPLGSFGFWGVYLMLSFGSALLLHFLIEKPFLLLKDHKTIKLPIFSWK